MHIKEEQFSLLHGFRDFSPYLFGLIAFELIQDWQKCVMEETVYEGFKGTGEQDLGSLGSIKGYILMT